MPPFVSASKSPTEDQVARDLNSSRLPCGGDYRVAAAEAEAEHAEPPAVNLREAGEEMAGSQRVADLLINRRSSSVAVALAEASKRNAQGGDALVGKRLGFARIHGADLVLRAAEAVEHQNRGRLLGAVGYVQRRIDSVVEDKLSFRPVGRGRIHANESDGGDETCSECLTHCGSP